VGAFQFWGKCTQTPDLCLVAIVIVRRDRFRDRLFRFSITKTITIMNKGAHANAPPPN